MTISVCGTARTLPRLTGSNRTEAAHRKVHHGGMLTGQSVQPMPRKAKRVCSIRDHLPWPGQKHAAGHEKHCPTYSTRTTRQIALHMNRSTSPLLCSPSNPHMLFPSNSKPGQTHPDEETQLQIHNGHLEKNLPHKSHHVAFTGALGPPVLHNAGQLPQDKTIQLWDSKTKV